MIREEAFSASPSGDVLLWNQILMIHAEAAEPTVYACVVRRDRLTVSCRLHLATICPARRARDHHVHEEVGWPILMRQSRLVAEFPGMSWPISLPLQRFVRSIW
jgi:hypothetical protein